MWHISNHGNKTLQYTLMICIVLFKMLATYFIYVPIMFSNLLI